ncbi:MAG: hypothetical protein QGI18_06840, partial [Candidatus Marinimicrobia bacterium]|nr:hypothetical protein [Candidatus Neomarinimicrobiota bacterium]
MKKYLFIILLVPFWSCEDEVPADDTLHTFELHSNNRVSSLLMTDSEYSNWVTNDGFTDASLRIDLINDIYKKFPDKYDFIFLVLNEPSIPTSLYYYGMLIGVSNDVQGIGKYNYDYSSDYGSSGKLKAVMQLTGLEYLKYGPALHELAHQWANFALPTHSVDAPGSDITSYLYGSHWGFTGGSTPGQLGGFKQSSLIENGNNSFTVDEFGPFANGGNGIPYNELELYLMGMIPVSSVSNFDMFTDITSLAVNSSTFDFTASTRTTYTPESLEELLGQRVPSAGSSQKDFKLLVVVITDDPLSDDEWDKVDATAEWFSKKEDDGTSL